MSDTIEKISPQILTDKFGIKPFAIETVEKLEFLHGVRNLAFLFGCIALTLLSVFLLLFFVPAAFVYGAVISDWNVFGAGLISIIAIPILAVVSVLGIALFWFLSIFQPATPAYFLIWLTGGIPLFAVAIGAGSAPTIVVLGVYD